MFTIEVKKREPNEKFSLGDLKMWHKECTGGEITYNLSSDWDELSLLCGRCHAYRKVELSEEDRIAIARLAVEGGEVKLGEDVVMIPRASET